jgi:hypothetical protein
LASKFEVLDGVYWTHKNICSIFALCTVASYDVFLGIVVQPIMVENANKGLNQAHCQERMEVDANADVPVEGMKMSEMDPGPDPDPDAAHSTSDVGYRSQLGQGE